MNLLKDLKTYILKESAFGNIMQYLILLFSLLFSLLGCTETVSSSPIEEPSTNQDSLSLADQEFWFNYEQLEKKYYWAEDELEEASVYYNAYIEGHEYGNVEYMYSMLSDDFTYYVEPDLLLLFMEMMFAAPSEVGTGIELNDSLEVLKVYKESPAELAGLEKGDIIVAVDDITIKQKETFERLTTGEEGDIIYLTFLRGEDTLATEIELFSFSLPTVYVDSVGGIPRIRITEFIAETAAGDSYKEWIGALEETYGAKSTIVDLRGNPGGDLNMCLDMASELLHKNDTIVVIKQAVWDENLEEQYIETSYVTAATEGLGADRYYVFLADSNSASCSETMLMAVTQNKKSPIIGSRTYGKGIIQNLNFTPANGMYSITFAEILDKNGEILHQRGLDPDFYSEDDEEILAKAIEFVELEQEREAGYGEKHLLAKKVAGSQKKSLKKPGAYIITGTLPKF